MRTARDERRRHPYQNKRSSITLERQWLHLCVQVCMHICVCANSLFTCVWECVCCVCVFQRGCITKRFTCSQLTFEFSYDSQAYHTISITHTYSLLLFLSPSLSSLSSPTIMVSSPLPVFFSSPLFLSFSPSLVHTPPIPHLSHSFLPSLPLFSLIFFHSLSPSLLQCCQLAGCQGMLISAGG